MSIKKKSTRMHMMGLFWFVYMILFGLIAIFSTKDYTWFIVGQVNLTLWFIGAEIVVELEKIKEKMGIE